MALLHCRFGPLALLACAIALPPLLLVRSEPSTCSDGPCGCPPVMGDPLCYVPVMDDPWCTQSAMHCDACSGHYCAYPSPAPTQPVRLAVACDDHGGADCPVDVSCSCILCLYSVLHVALLSMRLAPLPAPRPPVHALALPRLASRPDQRRTRAAPRRPPSPGGRRPGPVSSPRLARAARPRAIHPTRPRTSPLTRQRTCQAPCPAPPRFLRTRSPRHLPRHRRRTPPPSTAPTASARATGCVTGCGRHQF